MKILNCLTIIAEYAILIAVCHFRLVGWAPVLAPSPVEHYSELDETDTAHLFLLVFLGISKN